MIGRCFGLIGWIWRNSLRASTLPLPLATIGDFGYLDGVLSTGWRCRSGDPDGDPIPAYIERDFRQYLTCGILAQAALHKRAVPAVVMTSGSRFDESPPCLSPCGQAAAVQIASRLIGRARGAAIAPPATPSAWPKSPHISSITSFPKSPCGNPCSPCRSACGIFSFRRPG